MKALLKIGALTLALAAISAPAMARDGWRDGDRDHDRGGYDNRHDGRDDRWRGDDRRDDRRDDRGDWRGHGDGRGYYRPAPPPRVVYHNNYYREPTRVVYHDRYYGGGGYYAPRPQWVRGGRYYGNGYGPTYVVQDYGYYGLRPPPRGYGWRRSDAGDFLLVALTTGIIADLVFHH